MVINITSVLKKATSSWKFRFRENPRGNRGLGREGGRAEGMAQESERIDYICLFVDFGIRK